MPDDRTSKLMKLCISISIRLYHSIDGGIICCVAYHLSLPLKREPNRKSENTGRKSLHKLPELHNNLSAYFTYNTLLSTPLSPSPPPPSPSPLAPQSTTIALRNVLYLVPQANGKVSAPLCVWARGHGRMNIQILGSVWCMCTLAKSHCRVLFNARVFFLLLPFNFLESHWKCHSLCTA